VRTLLVLAIVVGAVGTADARKPRSRDMDFREFGDEAPEPCGRGKTWDVIRKCLGKGSTVTVMHQSDVVKIVALEDKKNKTHFKRLVMYTKREKEFVRAPTFSAVSSETNEVLAISDVFKTALGDAVRVDVGQTSRTNFSIASGNTRGILRRTFTTVCMPGNWNCVTLMTRCEAIAAGRTYYMFHGEPTWHPTLGLRMRGALEATGGVCKPSASLVLDE
jgi:hypothetical protein